VTISKPTKCSNCNSSDIRVVQLPEKVRALTGVWRYMCDQCGYCGAIFEDTNLHDKGKPDKKIRNPLSIEIVNAIRETIGKTPLRST